MKRYEADAVICGAGIAGVAAAMDLLSSGKKILLLDRDKRENFGGLACESFGGLLFVDTPEQRRAGIQDSQELALRDWLSFGAFPPDGGEADFPRRWAEAYLSDARSHVYDYVKSHGVRFLPLPLWVERGLYGDGNSVPRWHIVWGTGRGLMDRLIAALLAHPKAHNLMMAFDHRVDSFDWRAGRAAGAQGVVETDGSDFYARGETILIASGGINGDIARVKANWHKDWRAPPPVILNGSHRFADGRLHDAATMRGAQLTHLDKMWNYAAGVHHWRPRKPDHGLSLAPSRSALWVNARGERIGPMPLVSGFDTRDLVTQICKQDKQYSWQILNRRIALKELAISGAEFNPALRERNLLRLLKETFFGGKWLYHQMLENCVDVVAAETLGELTARMNALQGDSSVEAKVLAEAVNAYDADIARGPALHNDEQLRRIAHLRRWRGDRLRLCKSARILEPGAGPLLAIRLFIISRKSLGGLRTDLRARVVDAGDQPLDGLYAIGEAAGFGGGGMHGLRALEGSFLGGCIYSGRRAAQSIIAGG